MPQPVKKKKARMLRLRAFFCRAKRAKRGKGGASQRRRGSGRRSGPGEEGAGAAREERKGRKERRVMIKEITAGALRSPARAASLGAKKPGLELGRVKFSCNKKHNLF